MAKVIKHVYISKVLDPYENLAVEEYLISICKADEIIMFLWQNEKTIVIGKHQNPYKECHLPLMKSDGIKLVRRKSGGGAVFHDTGNLNFTFIAHKNNYSVDKHFQVILGALKDWDISGEQTGRNDLTIDGVKFSGNAFIHQKEVSCHHGTILVNAKLENLGKYLTPSKLKIESKGIDSVRARVTNLREFNDRITIDELKKDLIEKFDTLYEGDLLEKPIPSHENIQTLSKEYKNWKWNVAKSPKATFSKSKATSWGNVDVELNIKSGRIVNCLVNSDTLYDEPFSELAQAFEEKELQRPIIEETIEAIIEDKNISKDLIELFSDFIV